VASSTHDVDGVGCRDGPGVGLGVGGVDVD